MSNYRRLISYIYAYEGGIKGKNIGFAKIETRGIQCKITVNVKKVYVGGNDIGVYLLAGDQEIFLGNIFIRGGSGEFRTVVSVSDVEHSGISMDQCYGLTVHDVENTWRSYTTIWEDAVTHAAEVELPDAVMAKKEAEDDVQEAQIKKAMKEIEEEFPVESSEECIPDSTIPIPEPKQASEGVTVRMKEMAVNQPEQRSDREASAEKRVQNPETKQSVPQRPAVSAVPYIEPVSERSVPESVQKKAPVAKTEPSVLNQVDETNVYSKNFLSSVRSYSMAADTPAAAVRMGESEAMADNSFMSGAFGNTVCYRTDTANQMTEENAEGESVVYPLYLAGMEGAEPPAYQDDGEMTLNDQAAPPGVEHKAMELFGEQAAEALQAKGMIAEARGEKNGGNDNRIGSRIGNETGIEIGNETGIENEIESEHESGQWGPLNPQELSEQQNFESVKDRQEEENPPRPQASSRPAEAVLPTPGDPEELERLLQIEEAEENSSDQVWEGLKRDHTKILDFDYEKGCEIVTIKPQDIGLLPRETWVYGNNSFLLHGYYNYRYLILAKLFNPEGEPRYLLGVPGHYYSNERYMASMFGFPNFVLSKNQPIEDGRFGYWYTDIKIGGES